jgi:hypothetical protein
VPRSCRTPLWSYQRYQRYIKARHPAAEGLRLQLQQHGVVRQLPLSASPYGQQAQALVQQLEADGVLEQLPDGSALQPRQQVEVPVPMTLRVSFIDGTATEEYQVRLAPLRALRCAARAGSTATGGLCCRHGPAPALAPPPLPSSHDHALPALAMPAAPCQGGGHGAAAPQQEMRACCACRSMAAFATGLCRRV